MTEGERIAALGAARAIRPMLQRIGQGWLFCLDRNYPWTIEMEEREGRSEIAKALADHPVLAQRLAKTAGQLAKGEVLGDVDDLDATDAAIAFLAEPLSTTKP